jgi:hypothetical protein
VLGARVAKRSVTLVDEQIRTFPMQRK